MSAHITAAAAIAGFVAHMQYEPTSLVLSPDFERDLLAEAMTGLDVEGVLHGLPYRVDYWSDGNWIEARSPVSAMTLRDKAPVEAVGYYRLRVEHSEDLPRGNDPGRVDHISTATRRALPEEPPS